MFPSVKLLRQAAKVIVWQEGRIASLEREKIDVELAYMRICRDLMEQFLVGLDMPEAHDVFRQRLTVGLGFYRDEIAVREEHV